MKRFTEILLVVAALMTIGATTYTVVKVSEMPAKSMPSDSDLLMLASPSSEQNWKITWSQTKDAMRHNAIFTGITAFTGGTSNYLAGNTHFGDGEVFATNGVRLFSPNGTIYELTVDNDGNLTTVEP